MSESVIEIEGRPGEGFVLRIKPMAFSILPAETRSHVRAARKEMLLALRSILDQAIEHIDKAETPAPARTKIEVD